mmetsp:Transcript_5585/g.13021  ORF Transcript_5585/g.13021 Transcript_5585/m.13021 type:complete len:127 (-) Transcript_5585:67-447(-)
MGGVLCCPATQAAPTPETADEQAVHWRHGHRDGVPASQDSPKSEERSPGAAALTESTESPWWTDARLSGPSGGAGGASTAAAAPAGAVDGAAVPEGGMTLGGGGRSRTAASPDAAELRRLRLAKFS